jgi:hypothetical protein
MSGWKEVLGQTAYPRLRDSGFPSEGPLPAIPIVGFGDSYGFIVTANKD